MLTVSCPGCGAPVKFRSHASVMAVCEYCRTSVLKDLGSAQNIGTLSSVLEDYSPIQIGTAGQADGKNFTVVGRIQLRYQHGIWNEWYLAFDDGQTGWLGDASGQYTLTVARDAAELLPSFERLTPGQLYTIDSQRYMAADRRTARCIGGQGELPFKVGDGWEARVVDLRRGRKFITLDYSDGDTPQLYDGMAVTLPYLKCQLLRDDEAIHASAGRYRGKLDTLDCPSCGSAIKYVPGATAHLVCPACSARLDAASTQVQVLEAGERVERARLSLDIGASATINGSQHTVIGAMRKTDDEGYRWIEYLLFSTRAGFLWLIDAGERWYRAEVMDEWPFWDRKQSNDAQLKHLRYPLSSEYPARVEFAAGAFNWNVAAGDTVRVFEFEHDTTTLAAELSATELTWSTSTPVSYDQLKSWFGASLRAQPPARAAAASSQSAPVKFMWWVLALNFIPLMFNFFQTAIILVVAIIALFVPPAGFRNDD